MSNDPMLEMYLDEGIQLTERLEEILMEGEQIGGFNTEHINEIFRVMHTIKGSAAMMDFTQISTLAHSLEDMFYFIREHNDCTPDWAEIADICLEAVDFFKGEMAKIQNHLPSDGDMTELLARCHKTLEILSGKPHEPEEGAPAPAAPAAPAAAPPAAEAAPAAAEAAPAAAEGSLQVRVFFEEGCKMENIRAYQIVNALGESVRNLVTVPTDLLEDCSDEIIKHGVLLTMSPDCDTEVVRKIVSEAMFVKTFEISRVKHPEPAAATPEPAAAPPPADGAAPHPAAPAAAPHPAAKAMPPPPPPEVKATVINVNVDKLDKLMDLMGEIVISVAMVVGSPDLADLKLDKFEKAASQLLKNTNELQNIIMSVRMIPISSTFHKMHRIVRDTSKKLDKEVELVILGEETEVDKNIIDNLSDPLMHIVRNSMDHGIEDDREERVAAEKPPVGRITLEARNSGSDVIISCTDDGRGLDKDKILAKARRSGLLTHPESEYTDKEIYQFIMLAGFSTNEQVTELSGRGVGMDVVKKNIEKIGGTVLLDSTPGKGMTVTIRIPLTLAILQSIEIKVGHNLYLIPTLSIRESFRPELKDIIVDPDGNEMILFRGECYTIIRLAQQFCVTGAVENFNEGVLIMVEDEGHMVGLFADGLVSEQQAVVKPIPSFITERIGSIRGISGCTIMGNGNIDLIIDVKSLAK
ncbi:MAG: chemotaxis protein CheA [Oscillospiraceae bacterium]|jgi:two-component system chemotaxis sensor kinase CheA|nr:chemotaxis protein CheA [Oscillospiraceae bacterium]